MLAGFEKNAGRAAARGAFHPLHQIGLLREAVAGDDDGAFDAILLQRRRQLPHTARAEMDIVHGQHGELAMQFLLGNRQHLSHSPCLDIFLNRFPTVAQCASYTENSAHIRSSRRTDRRALPRCLLNPVIIRQALH